MTRLLLLAILVMLTSPSWGQARYGEEAVALETDSGTLYGTLLVPQSSNPVPVVLLIAGSGPTDRNGNNTWARNDSLKKLARALGQQGIASLRYDKRGVAASQPAGQDERTFSVARYTEDAAGWGRQLLQDPRFGPLIIAGHSEGALIATLAAPASGASALITMAGSGRPIDHLLIDQLSYRLDPELLAYSKWLIEELEAGRTHNDVPSPLRTLFRPSVQPYLISLFHQQPAQAFAALQIPALIVQGTHDMQVSVDDALALRQAYPASSLCIVPGMNHVLRILEGGFAEQLASYADPDLPLAQAATECMIQFIRSRQAPVRDQQADMPSQDTRNP